MIRMTLADTMLMLWRRPLHDRARAIGYEARNQARTQ